MWVVEAAQQGVRGVKAAEASTVEAMAEAAMVAVREAALAVVRV